MSRDGTKDRVLTASDQLAEGGRLSPDGIKVLFMARDPERKVNEGEDDSGLFVRDLRRDKAARLQGQPLIGSCMGYCWSPDGRRIAHAWRLDQGPREEGEMIESFLVVSDADGSNPVTIATERGDQPGLITLSDPDWR
jgi:Tol biopolymer transport system component